MKVVVGSAVKGFALKEAVKTHLQALGHEVMDVGCHDTSVFVKFPSIAERIALALTTGKAQLAVNCCGSGTGASIATNKYQGTCAVNCESIKTAMLARVVNDANCLCMGEAVVSTELACNMAEAFVAATFQDAKDIPAEVLEFWREARDELLQKGSPPRERDIECLKMK